MLALLFALGQAAPVADYSREERVLGLMRTLEREEGSWRYSQARFVMSANGAVRPQLSPRYPLFCATMSEGIRDERFRTTALELLRIYDLEPQVDCAPSMAGVEARLDGFDPGRGLGFELRGRGDPGERGAPLPEPTEHALDDAELALLERAGVRLYVADRARYSHDEDGFTPALAFLAGLVRFLNHATEGEDVELGGLLFEREAAWNLHVEPAAGMRLEAGMFGALVLVVERHGRALVRCPGASDFGLPIVHSFSEGRGMELAHTTLGAPAVFAVKHSVSALEQGEPRPEFCVRFRQRFLTEELVHETRSFVAFLPSTFDLAWPFEIELDLPPGRYSFFGEARIGAAAGKNR